MINHLLKIGVIYQFWRWLKPRLQLFSVALMLILITWIIHSEFTKYLGQLNSIEESKSDLLLGASYVLKWATTLGVVFVVYICEKLRIKDISKRAKSKVRISKNYQPNLAIKGPDPFEKIRQKKELESRADKLLR